MDKIQPFGLLPEALVEQLLSQSDAVGKELIQNLAQLKGNKEKYRAQLQSAGLLKKYSDLPDAGIPTTCGVDGSYVVERLMATDLVACAAVAVEGLTPPIEKRYWEKPDFLQFIAAVKHDPETTKITQGIVWEMEVTLASKAPHDVVFLDGSLTNPFGKINAGMSEVAQNPGIKNSKVGITLLERFEGFLDAYNAILNSNRSDKLWIGVPKYTSLREIGSKPDLNWPESFDDRAMLTSILQAGEYTSPVKHATAEKDPWHITLGAIEGDSHEIKDKLENTISAIRRLHVLYYKPHSFIPAIRLEVPPSVASNNYQLKMLLQAINFQCQTPGIMEPYPLYMADRMVKNLSSAVPAFRQTVTNSMAINFEGDLTDIFFNMHSYRTEGGK